MRGSENYEHIQTLDIYVKILEAKLVLCRFKNNFGMFIEEPKSLSLVHIYCINLC